MRRVRASAPSWRRPAGISRSSSSTTARATTRWSRPRPPAPSVLRQRPNQGKGAALRRGFRQALDDGVDAVVTLDADGQHDPAEIPALPRGAGGGARGRSSSSGGATSGRCHPPGGCEQLGRKAFSWAVGQDVPDNQSGYRLIGRRLMAEMLESRESGFEFEVEMITMALRRDWPIAWVPIRTIYGAPSHIRPVPHLRHFLRATRAARRLVRESR